MGRALAYVPYPYCPIEVTIKCVGAMRLAQPSDELNEIVLGVLGRALDRSDVRLYDIIFMGNHIQYLVGARDALALAEFMCFFHGNVAREVGRIRGWRGRIWSRRGRPIPVVDDDALERRIRYIYEHGVKERLVTSPMLWPGASSVKARVTGEPLRGTWFDRTAEYHAKRRGEDFGKYDYAIPYEIELHPAPCWEHLDEEAYRDKVRRMVADIEADAAEAARDGVHFAGLEVIEQQDPFEVPKKTKHGRAPPCHASTKRTREEYLRGYLDFAQAYYEAAAQLVAGVLDVAFPEGSFPRPRPFVPPTESLAPS
jgi:hypothetical protein